MKNAVIWLSFFLFASVCINILQRSAIADVKDALEQQIKETNREEEFEYRGRFKKYVVQYPSGAIHVFSFSPGSVYEDDKELELLFEQ